SRPPPGPGVPVLTGRWLVGGEPPPSSPSACPSLSSSTLLVPSPLLSLSPFLFVWPALSGLTQYTPGRPRISPGAPVRPKPGLSSSPLAPAADGSVPPRG